MRFNKFRCGVWFHTETLQMFEIEKSCFDGYYDISELDVFGECFSGSFGLVKTLEALNTIPCEYLGAV